MGPEGALLGTERAPKEPERAPSGPKRPEGNLPDWRRALLRPAVMTRHGEHSFSMARWAAKPSARKLMLWLELRTTSGNRS